MACLVLVSPCSLTQLEKVIATLQERLNGKQKESAEFRAKYNLTETSTG